MQTVYLLGNDCCSWSGVVCNNITGNVQEIHVRGPDDGIHGHCYGSYDTEEELEEASKQMLGGTISPLVTKLFQLTYLDLSCNNFESIRIPAFFGFFQNLRYLNLSKSQFSGEIPHQLGNLSTLRVLDLHQDPIVSNLHSRSLKWLNDLKELQHLDMGGVNLGRASDWFRLISTLSSLLELHCSSCGLVQFPSNPTTVSFTSLNVLDLSHNIFSDSLLPQWIFSLHDLVSLDLTGCFISGLNPGTHSGFYSMPSLTTLRVSSNTFMNSSSLLNGLSSISNLRLVDVSNCNISVPILGSLRSFSLIVHLDLSTNMIVEQIPKSLSNLCNLITLDLQANHFFGNVSELLERFCECESPKPEVLGLRGNYLIGQLPEKLGRLKNLESIDFAYNMLTRTLPDSVGSLSLLKTLQMNINQLTGSIPNTIGGLSMLNFLDLSYNKLNGNLPESIGRLGKLVFLTVHHNSLTGILTENHFTNLTSLKTLWIGDNKLEFKLNDKNWIPPFQLEVLRIGSSSLGPHFPLWIQSQTNLVQMDLANTNISDTIPNWFWNTFSSVTYLNISKSLMIIELAENELAGRISASIGRYDTRLKVLSLRFNKLEGKIPYELCYLNSIQILDLAHNDLSGNLPTCFTNFRVMSGSETSSPFLLYNTLFQNRVLGSATLVTKGRVATYGNILYLVTTLDLSNNKVSGSIPNELVSLLGLRYLNLSQNDLTGQVPNIFSKTGKLESLDLSLNHLDGKFPSSLSTLTALSFLNVWYNNLVGRIPTGPQLQTFNESSFVGNSLCWNPLPACLQNTDDPRGTKDENHESNGVDWILVIFTLTGLVIGFWIMIIPLIASKRWRYVYHHFLEEISIKLQHFIHIIKFVKGWNSRVHLIKFNKLLCGKRRVFHSLTMWIVTCRRREPVHEILGSTEQVQQFDEPEGFRRHEPAGHEILSSTEQVQQFDEPEGFQPEWSTEASSSTHEIQQYD